MRKREAVGQFGRRTFLPLVLVLGGLPVRINAQTPAAQAATESRITIHNSTYNPQLNTLTTALSVAPAVSANPSSSPPAGGSSATARLTITIDLIYITSEAVMFVGTVIDGSTVLGPNIWGAPVSFSFAYAPGGVSKISRVTEVVAGRAVLYSLASKGSLTITQPSGDVSFAFSQPEITGDVGGDATWPPPPDCSGSDNGVNVVIVGPSGSAISADTFQTFTNQIVLDASRSTSTNGGALSYTWTASPGFPKSVITGANTASPFIELSKKGDYQFILTVVNSTGGVSKVTVTVRFVSLADQAAGRTLGK